MMKVKEESEKAGLRLNIQKTRIMVSSLITSWQIEGEIVMYECESWTVKKSECRRIDAFELLEKTLESPLDCKEIQPVHPKGD